MLNLKESQDTRPGNKQDAFEEKLTARVMGYVMASDVGEEARRRHDRIGGRIFYGQHWERQMPSDRAAITCNLAMSLLLHKVAIMTKQDPQPIVEPDDVGDSKAAEIMRPVIQRVWSSTNMRNKSRRLLCLSNATRTAAFKAVWDPELNYGNGGINTDVIAGWNLIMDDRVGDPELQEFAGDRATMSRSRAMLLYPDAAKKIQEAAEQALQKRGPLGGKGSPITTPWRSANIPSTGTAVVNGKPVVTAFAGEMVQSTPQTRDVEVAEVYHKDRSTIIKTVAKRDSMGRIKQDVIRDAHGVPQFELGPDETVEINGMHISIPMPKLAMQDVYEERLVRKYPSWRRTTILIPDNIMLEDIAWDGPLPYAYNTDIEPLDGIRGRGSLLQNEHLQALLNVGLSTITDNLRMGSLNAWLAGSQSGLTSSQIIPGVGQVIPVHDVTAVRPLTAPGLDANFFTLLDRVVTYMERIIGATGVMQGEAAGRADSSGTYDTLAEIGGARLDECTQRFETTLSQWARIVGWMAQKYYTEAHAIAVENDQGDITWERAGGPLLQGSFSYTIQVGSTMAWSESATQQRDFQEMEAQIIDKIEYWQRQKTPNWRKIMARQIAASGPQTMSLVSPPPRTRVTAPRPPAAVF